MAPLLLLPPLVLALIGLRGGEPAPQRHPALATLPARMVWAWERPEDLRWLPRDVGVAYVAASVVLRGDEAIVHPRMAPLLTADGVARVPVLHVDASWREPPALNALQAERVVRELLRVAQRGNRHVVQLDFEVRRSQRPFLARVMAEARRRLPPGMALSVTALASWCLDDHWLPSGLADEIVPMAFRMGPGEQALRQRLRRDGFPRHACRHAAGYATDEPGLRGVNPRSYYFSPRPWTPATWRAETNPTQPPT
ncbi:hypothetical protein [Pseudoduganella namucuonensis]|uniref:hypothetical protein n=1 Tax=Pseudoduganella namucuonensis TaxID=1035707 RepID=UPI0011605E95|nr:hypothetical protein [Pseudoduganella namucuonensis]